MENVEFLGLTIDMFGSHELESEYNLGGITLSYEGREYKVDICQSSYNDDSGDLVIECELEIDKDELESTYDLTPTDLYSRGLKAEIYIDGTFGNIIDSITLFVKHNGCTKAIDLEQE